MTELPSLADFAPLVGERFHLAYPGHAEALTLVSATPSRISPSKGSAAGFALLFDGQSRSVLLGQHIYRLAHPRLGAIDLFLVPVARLAGGNFRYESCFG